MLAYSTVAHNTGVHLIPFERFCSPSLTNLAPPSGQRLQSDRKLYVFRPCSSLSAAAAPSPNVSPQCTFPIYRLLGLSPLASFCCKYDRLFCFVPRRGCSHSTQQECKRSCSSSTGSCASFVTVVNVRVAVRLALIFFCIFVLFYVSSTTAGSKSTNWQQNVSSLSNSSCGSRRPP